jgi:hypothetical protein
MTPYRDFLLNYESIYIPLNEPCRIFYTFLVCVSYLFLKDTG